MTDRTVVNNTWTDLHPDDQAARVELRDLLRAHSRSRGLAEREVAAAAGRKQGWAASIWAQDSWLLSSMQAMSRALGYRLAVDTVQPLPTSMAPVQMEMWDAMNAVVGVDAAGRDTVSRMILADTARRLREYLELSPAQLGALLGHSARRVTEWEAGEKPDYPLITAQRHFRALGYPLSFTLLDEDDEPVPPPTPGDPEAPTAPTDPLPQPVTQPSDGIRITYDFGDDTVTLTVGPQAITMSIGTFQMFTRCRH